MYEWSIKVDESLLKTEVAIFTGGRDINNHLIVTFPAVNLDKLAEVGSAGLVQIIRYYLSVTDASDRQQGFTFVGDLQASSQDSNQVLVEALEFLQNEKRGNVSNVYLLKPKSRTKSKYLKKQLGLRESKKNPKVATFPATLLKNVNEVYSRIDRTQLTEDLGGSLQHDQLAWIQFHHMIDPLMEAVCRRQSLLPGARDRVQLLQDYDTAGLTTYQLETLVTELQDRYHSIMRELDVENTIDWCNKMIERLNKPEDEVVLSKVSSNLLTATIALLNKASKQLVQGREEMTNIWTDTENHFQKLIQLFHIKRETTAMCEEISRFWLPKVEQPANIGSTLSQAEMYRTYFITSLYDPAKVLVGKATELLQGIRQLHQETPSLESELDFLPSLAQLVQTFTEKLERLHNTYLAIHIFYLMFEKLAQWYQKVLRFIPSTLSSQVEKARKQEKSSIPVLPKWAQAVRSFLNKHPGPRNEHISTIEYPVSILPDAQLCTQARLLARRIRSLNKLLTSTQQFPLVDISNALAWKRRSLEGNDDIVIPSQIDPPLNKSYNTDRDLDREVADIACDNNNNNNSEKEEEEPHQRPATALGISDKTVTFADQTQSATEIKSTHRELSKSSQDLSRQSTPDRFSVDGIRPASSFDILPENGSHSLRVKGERFVSLSYSSQLQNMTTRNLHGTLPKSHRFKLPPSELEKIFQPPPAASFVSNTGSVVDQLQQLMNSGLTADEKLYQAQLVLQASSSQQPPASPFFLGGNLTNSRFSFQGEHHSNISSQFHDLSPRTNACSDWKKLSRKDDYETLTKSMPNLEEALENQNAKRVPPLYNLSSAIDDNQGSHSNGQADRGGVRSAREIRSSRRVGDWIEQHARTVHAHNPNSDADVETDDGYSEAHCPGDRHRRKPRKQKTDRKKDENNSSMSKQYNELLDASKHQEEVEISLRRAQKILQDEEFNLKERNSKYTTEADMSVDRSNGDLTSGVSLDESTEMPDSPGLSLDSSKSDRTVPSVSTDRGYASSTNQRSGEQSEKRSIGRSMSSDSSSTIASVDNSPNSEGTITRTLPDTLRSGRSSPLITRERRKSILRQPVVKPLSPKETIPTRPAQINNHVPVIRRPSAQPMKSSKSLENLLSIDDVEDNEPIKLGKPGMRTRRPRSSRRLSLISFSSNQNTSTQNEPLSMQTRRLSMETIVEVPKQEETVQKDLADLRAQRRRRKKSDLKLANSKLKSGMSSSVDLSKSLDFDSQSESRSLGKHHVRSGWETERTNVPHGTAPWDWNTKPGPTFNLVDSFRHKLTHHMKTSSENENKDDTTSDPTGLTQTQEGSPDMCNSESPGDAMTVQRMTVQRNNENDREHKNGDIQREHRNCENHREHRNGETQREQNNTSEDIKKLSDLDEKADKSEKKIRLRRDVPCSRSNGPLSSYTMRGTRGTFASSLPKHYVRKNSKVFDGFNSEPNGESSSYRLGKNATIASAAGHRLVKEEAWSLFR